MATSDRGPKGSLRTPPNRRKDPLPLLPGVHHPFASKAQWRLFFANPRLRRWARAKAHATPPAPVVRYRRLPRYSSAAGRASGAAGGVQGRSASVRG